jgi:cellobionic acid phosphorylase
MPKARRAAAQWSGFNPDGSRCILREVRLLDRADADLWNDLMHIQIDHRGRCSAGFLQPNRTEYAGSLRAFYVRDERSGRFWSAPYEPVQAEPQEFEFSVGVTDIRWRNLTDGLELLLRLVVPREDTIELWTATLTNRSRKTRRVSLFPCFPIGTLSPLAHRAWYDRRLNGSLHAYFPYYVKYQDYYRLRPLKNVTFCAADVRPGSYEVNLEDFAGWRGLHDPRQLHLDRLRRGDAHAEASIAALQYTRDLKPGQSFNVNLILGPARDAAEALRLKRRYLRPGGIERALGRAAAFHREHAPCVRVQTPDKELNHYLNVWQPNRSLMLGRTLRFTFAPQGRNAIQDAMGAVYVDPAQGRQWFSRIWAFQHRNGWMPHGMSFVPDAAGPLINAIPHRDINSWGPSALHFYVAETGDFGVLDEKVPFADGGRPATLYEHICLGLEWLLKDRTKRGLSRIGQGDWNDPLNMAGHGEKGESVWLTQALSFGLDQWAEVAERSGERARARRYRRQAQACRRAVNRYAWTGRWYARGFTDAGRPFGVRGDREGRIFINPQSWSLICGAARGARAEQVIASVRKHLLTDWGAMTLYPAFSSFREDIGKLTQKPPGTGENASAYCHATTFLAYALFRARQSDLAFSVLRRLLPGYGRNTVARAGQLPIYIPNFYRGIPAGRSVGRSSHSPNTGTAAWYYRTAVSMLLGVRGEFDGLRLDPQLPSHWRQARVWRSFRGAAFEIVIRRRAGLKRARVILDGKELPDNLVPVLKPGSRHVVLVLAP